MDYDAEDRREEREADMTEVPEQDIPQFQLVLRASDGDHVMGASSTVNELVEQAQYWLNASDEGIAIKDSQVRSVILQEVDPATGAYVDSREIPVDTKQQVIQAARTMGAR